MKKLILSIFILTSWISFAQVPTHHAEFSNEDGYSLKAKRFIDLNLKSESKYSLDKIDEFIQRLKSEKKFLMKQVYETTLLEELELRIEDEKDAIKEAKEELDDEKSSYSILFEKYLLPRLNQLGKEVEADENCETICDALVDEIMLGYSAVFSPDLHRSQIQNDVAIGAMAKRLRGFKFEKVSPLKNEANNLAVEASNFKDINNCLEVSVEEGHFLNKSQLDELKECGYDLSLLDPRNSPLWQKDAPTSKDLEEEAKNLGLFPKKDTILSYKKVQFSGFGSPKFKAEFKENGEKKKVHVKLGYEVHTDPVLSALGKMLGLHQDESVYRKNVIVRFKSQKHYDRFLSQMIKKYTTRFRNNLVKIDKRGGEVFVTFRYVRLEANRKNIIKLNPIDQSGWDNLNRREYRAMILWFAWVNLRDTRNGNWRIQLLKKGDKLIPQVSQQDVGQGLMGAQAFKKNPLSLLSNAMDKTHLNSFEKSILTWDDEMVRVQWTDTLRNPDVFSTTTFSDLKWMARKIAKLTKKDIEYALSLSGLTEIEQRLYVAKLVNRRNEFVKAFELEDEVRLLHVFDIDNYNINGLVKNGKILPAVLKGTSRYQRNISPLYYLTQLLTYDKRFSDMSAKIGREFGLSGELFTGKIPDGVKGKTLFFSHPGIAFKITRGVEKTRMQQFADSAQKFYSVDRLSVELDVRLGAVRELLKNFPLTLQTKVKVLRFDFEHFQPAETIAQAIRAPFKIISILKNKNQYLAYDIKAGEIFNMNSSNGISVGAELRYKKIMKFGTEISYISSTPVYFHRNYFGELEIYKDVKTERSIKAYAKAELGDDFIFLPLVGVEVEFNKTKGNSIFYKLWSKKQELNVESPTISQIRDQFETRILDTLIDGGVSEALPLMRKEYLMNYEINSKRTRLFFLIWNHKKVREYSKFNVELPNKEKKNFHRYVMRKENITGSSELAGALGGLIYLKGDQQVIETQVDENDPNKFIVIQNVYDYERKLNRKKLVKYINKLNKSFSKKSKKPFFQITNLPKKEEVDSYKKVLAHNRVFYYGDKLFKRLKKIGQKGLEELGQKLAVSFSGKSEQPTDSDYSKAQSVMDKLVKSSRYLKEKNYKLFSKTFSVMIKKLNIQRYGMKPTLILFEEDEIFVSGEVYGILESFSTTINQYTTALNRRYTGNSWGRYRRTPPVWKYLNNNPVFYNVLPQIYRNQGFDKVFGVLPNGAPVIR